MLTFCCCLFLKQVSRTETQSTDSVRKTDAPDREILLIHYQKLMGNVSENQ